MIDINIHNSLRMHHNPDGSYLRTLQLESLEILKEFDAICRRNNIKYILSSGTLLGAIRHNGYIPWDDDIDIEMLKSEYKKLLKILPEELDSKYVVHSHQNDPFFIIPFIKIREKRYEIIENSNFSKKYNKKGLFIDIFPIEKTNFISSFVSKWMYTLLLIVPISKFNLPKWYANTVFFILFKVLFPIMRLFTIGGSYRQVLGSVFLKPRREEYYNDLINVTFEDNDFLAPKEYDKYLRSIYGDYMNIPYDNYSHMVEIKLKNNIE